MNPSPLQPLTRAATVSSLAKNARSARVIAKPLAGYPSLQQKRCTEIKIGTHQRIIFVAKGMCRFKLKQASCLSF